ncbi:MAG: TadE/TadG family type IV pilus assembly protein [Phenylobacterium sp.]|jgi:Flp pilus assembly pilin Flp|uniref:TadE/TadG family type IV pilus assembly protein n=1 Tax=Phenylobacterium sp. TaxID=1871053 RepID=UPI00391ADF0A
MGAISSSPFRRLIGDEGGAAAAELAIWVGVLIVPLLSAADFGYYVFQQMQLDNAAQVAAQAGWKACDSPEKWPATAPERCVELEEVVLAAAQSTSLGQAVTLSLPIEEAYYCPDEAGDLIEVGRPPDPKPADCSAAPTSPAETPGDYIQVTLSYAYSPIFRGLSLAELLPSPITRTAWMRLE